MTTVTKLAHGECILVTMQDEENEVRVHLHLGDGYRFDRMMGLIVKSAKLGLLYEEGSVVGGECGR